MILSMVTMGNKAESQNLVIELCLPCQNPSTLVIKISLEQHQSTESSISNSAYVTRQGQRVPCTGFGEN